MPRESKDAGLRKAIIEICDQLIASGLDGQLRLVAEAYLRAFPDLEIEVEIRMNVARPCALSTQRSKVLTRESSWASPRPNARSSC